MNSVELIRHMVAGSGKGIRQVSRDMGRSDMYLSSSLSRGSSLSADNLAIAAKACGYRIEAVRESDGERIELG